LEQVEVISQSFIKAKRALTSWKPNTEEIERSIATLRIALDVALYSRPDMPVTYIQILLNELDKDDFISFHKHFEQIRPALVIRAKPWQVEKLDSLLVYLRAAVASSNKEAVARTKTELSETLRAIRDEQSAQVFLTFRREPMVVQLYVMYGLTVCALVYFMIRRANKFQR
jgi:hypothetical protein